MIYTVFFTSGNEMPQDFETYNEAEAYGNEMQEDFVIESTTGELV